jgi:phospholipid/cholesterol/gamma-HCH transport system ATP-binding protein
MNEGEVSSVYKSFGERQVLKDVSFAIPKGQVIGLVGPGGSGKSVLLKILGGVLKQDAGVIDLKGASCGLSFQEGALFDSMSVLDNVAFPLLERRECSRTEAYQRAYKVLSDVGLGQAVSKHMGQLSGGMIRRVGIARALVVDPSFLLLDDPTGGLDPIAASVIMNLVIKLHKEHSTTVIIVSHDIRRLLPRVDFVMALFNGRIKCFVERAKLKQSAPSEVISFLSTRYDFE